MSIIQKIGDYYDRYISHKQFDYEDSFENLDTQVLVQVKMVVFHDMHFILTYYVRMAIFFIPLYIYYKLISIFFPKIFTSIRYKKRPFFPVNSRKPDTSKVDSNPFEDLGIGD